MTFTKYATVSARTNALPELVLFDLARGLTSAETARRHGLRADEVAGMALASGRRIAELRAKLATARVEWVEWDRVLAWMARVGHEVREIKRRHKGHRTVGFIASRIKGISGAYSRRQVLDHCNRLRRAAGLPPWAVAGLPMETSGWSA